MPFKVKPYVSEVTRFLEDLKRSDTQLEAKQRQGRARLWDRPQDPELAQAFEQARVPQKPYVYDSH
jgi:hypothetical protein